MYDALRFDTRSSVGRRAGAGLAALTCAAAGTLIASHYPLEPTLVTGLFLAWSAAALRWPSAWLVVVPALLPVIDLATWTGAFSFEEVDLLALGAAAGSYAAIAFEHDDPQPVKRSGWGWSLAATVLVVLLALSYASATRRGMAASGGFDFDWIGTYYSSMNTARIAKSFVLALLLWPVLRWRIRRHGSRSLDLLAHGIVLGLAGACLATLWERAAFTDLINFSTDYRTTALFWEMHVGGAALDGFLALTFPFAVWELRRDASSIRFACALVVVVAAVYACLMTFSRGVYAAVPIGLATIALLQARQRGRVPWRTSGRACLLLVVAACAVYLVFRHGGYRSLLAFIVVVVVGLLPDAGAAGGLANRLAPLAGGLAVGAALGAGAVLIGKGPYVLFALLLALNLLAWLRSWRGSAGHARWSRPAAFGMLIAAAGAIPLYWSGTQALIEAIAALLVALAFALQNAQPPTGRWVPRNLRSAALVLIMLGVLGAATAAFHGGTYMNERLAAISLDSNTRMRHWEGGIAMLETSGDWWLGRGLGRFPADYFFHSLADRALPGSFSIQRSDGGYYLSLAGPRYPTSWGDLFRIAQRVTPSPGSYTAILELRTHADVEVHVEVCEQHLIYSNACGARTLAIHAKPDWQRVTTDLNGLKLSRGEWFAPRLGFFSLAVESTGRTVDVRGVALIGPDGRSMLANGDFASGIARWIPISERYHLPWHIKNLELGILYDQGIAGLTVFLLLCLMALWRLCFAQARNHPMAPYLAAALLGFILVGVFDSLLDVPRLAMLFFLLLLASLALPGARPPATPADPAAASRAGPAATRACV